MSDAPSIKLIQRIRAHKLIPSGAPAAARRTNASLSAKNSGSWTWFVINPITSKEYRIGSQYPMRQLLGTPVWDLDITDWGDTEIDPCTCKNPEIHQKHETEFTRKRERS